MKLYTMYFMLSAHYPHRSRPSMRAETPSVLGQMRGTSTFSISLSSHTLMLAISLQYLCLTAVYEYIRLLLVKNYAAAVDAILRKLQASFFSCATVSLRYSYI